MYIISEDSIHLIEHKHVILELDTVIDPDTQQHKTYYCVIHELPINDLPILDHHIQAHAKLISEYKSQNWGYCLSACQGLKGKWNGELDSFYDCLHARIGNILARTQQ